MAFLRYSIRADADLLDVAIYTLVTWSGEQAERYMRELEDCCRLLADNPKIGRECDHISRGLRRIESGKHVVFYRILPDAGIWISRVLHQGMSPGNHDFEDDSV